MSQGASKRRLSRFLEESSLIRHYLWKYRKWVLIGLFSLVIVDILEVVPPILLKRVVDITVERGSTRALAGMALLYIGISLIQGLCRYGWRMYLIRSSIFSGRDLRNRYVKHLFQLSLSFFDRRRMGDLMTLAISDVEAVRIAMGTGLLVLADALFYLMTVPVAMYILSPKLMLLACLPLPIIPIIVLKNEKRVNERFEKVQDCFGKISATVQENLNGIRVVKGFAQEDTQIRRLKEVGEEFAKLNINLASVQSALGPSMDFVMSIGLVVLLYVGGQIMIQDSSSAVTLGTFVAFQRYVQKMVWPMSALGMAINYYQRAVSSSKRLKDVLAISSDVPNPATFISPKSTQGRIEFKGLYFSFPNSNHRILKDINLEVEPGERLAFVGSIGAGKSSLLSLIPRLYPVQRGMLFVDGLEINDWPIEELRKQVGYVSQDVFLFSETVLENVAFGLQDWAAQEGLKKSTLAIEQATQLASVHDEITRLTASYQTRLGERGINLSGGQKQRLTIARALTKQSPVLILDDALSSVDIHTEEQILKSLRARPHKNTELISAHRISTIKDADRIVVLNDGKIVQQGTHQQLIKSRSGEYWKFFEQQKLVDDLERFENELR